jgi:fructosamine-3-kinase
VTSGTGGLSGTRLTRLAQVLGPVGPIRRLGSNVWMVVAGRSLVVKFGAGCLDESEGLRLLIGVRGAPPVPEVVHADADLLVTTPVRQVARSPDHEVSFGRALATLHRSPFPHWGGGSSWIGSCRVDPAPWPDAAAFYGARLMQLAAMCRLEAVVSSVVGRLGELLPPDGPALLHGDLWWGNVLFGSDGRGWVIDPSVHGGHPEEDLGMLGLFGEVPDRLLNAYGEVRSLSPGWEERAALFRLYPLLVHTVLFGGGYRARAESVARRFA